MQDSSTADERLVINARWLIKLRWVAVGGQLATVLGAQLLLGVPLPLPALLVVIAITAVSNLGLAAWFQHRRQQPLDGQTRSGWHGVLGGIMLLDLLSLTTLLLLTGGPANPFTVFFFVNLGLAAILLPPRWAWLLNGFAVGCLAGLLYWHLPLPELQGLQRLQNATGFRLPGLAERGLLVAFVTCTSVIVYFTTRLTAELQRRESAWRQAEARRARSQHLEALGTMAAGAAHELATPLGTIAVVAKEMERELSAQPSPALAAQLAEDLRVVRAELDRCRAILDRMSTDSGHAIGEALADVSVEQLLECLLSGLPSRERVQATCPDPVRSRRLRVPCQGLSQALRGLVQNALDASPPGAGVRLLADCQNGTFRLLVADSGVGMNEQTLRRAGEPFFTTKAPGKGMGLGLFLARSVIERLDGQLAVQSNPGAGTRVCVQLPLSE